MIPAKKWKKGVQQKQSMSGMSRHVLNYKNCRYRHFQWTRNFAYIHVHSPISEKEYLTTGFSKY